MEKADNEYERQRQENIRRNQEILQQLQLASPGANSVASPYGAAKRKGYLTSAEGTDAQGSNKRTPLKKIKRALPTPPSRKSRRLQHMAPEEQPDIESDPLAARQSQRIRHLDPFSASNDSQVYSAASPSPARPRRWSGNLSLEEVSTLDNKADAEKHIRVFKSLCQSLQGQDKKEASESTKPPTRGTQGRSAPEPTADTAFQQLVSKFTNLHVRYPDAATHDEPTCKVTPQRIYTVAVHPSAHQLLVCAGDKGGVIGFWNLGSTDALFGKDTNDELSSESESKVIRQSSPDSRDQDEGVQVYTFQPYKNTVTQLMYARTDATKLYSSSYSGSIRCLDLENQKFTETCISGKGDPFITSFDTDSATGQCMYYSTSSGTLGFHDLRTKATDLYTWDLLERKIGCLHLNPRHSNYLVTASLDRTMRIWDLRWMKDMTTDAPPTLERETSPVDSTEVAAFEYSKSVTAAYWDPSGRQIVSTNFDDTIRVSRLGGTTATLEEQSIIGHNNQTGRWLTMFRATWHPSPDVPPCFVVGNMKRYVDIYCGTTGKLVTQLYDPERITAVPAVNAFHPSLPVIVSGNGSGRMVVWGS
ncbi:hypothetical protein IWQ62_002446 [Dispira parvispora]|uniref:DNA damage-binding protein CMR1 n=1 Tax=Dispira parvispora TaxID=1520584 RepID=A0A9W8AWQ2_9FUNG|nr:hypothetical protein IWQ62_002446 [Dispira parvispora]